MFNGLGVPMIRIVIRIELKKTGFKPINTLKVVMEEQENSG